MSQKEKAIHLASGYQISATDYANQANAILGIRKAGKSYTAMKAAEELLEAGIPIIVFDPVGIWKNLKTGVKGHKGYPVVVAGGEGSDIRLTPENAKEIVRAAMKEGVSLVIDLYSPELIHKATWIRVVQESVDLLMYENKPHGLRHIFLEEAAEFIPQRVQPQHGKVYAALERVARMGRNAGLGITLINQRAEEVNKAILEICELSLLHQQVGKNSLASIQKWLEIRQIDGVKDIIRSLPMLKRGECWAIALDDQPRKIMVSQKKTFHPDPNSKTDNKEAATTVSVRDVSTFVTRVNEQLEREREKKGKPVQKETKKVDALNSISSSDKVVKLESQNRDLQVRNGQLLAEIKNYKKALLVYEERNTSIANQIIRIGEKLTDSHGVKFNYQDELNPVPKSAPPIKPHSSQTKVQASRDNSSEKRLPPGEKAVLIACAQFGHGLDRNQLTVLTGYKRSSRDAYIARLKEKGLLSKDTDKISASQEGIDLLGHDFEPLPTGSSLRQYWLQKLPLGERSVLEFLINHYPDSVSRDEISEATGYMRSSRDAYIARMSAKELIEVTGPGKIRASENLF
jgi:hypothetical protein